MSPLEGRPRALAVHGHPERLATDILHDDGEREFDYTSGAEQALEHADTSGWTVVSIKNVWANVF